MLFTLLKQNFTKAFIPILFFGWVACRSSFQIQHSEIHSEKIEQGIADTGSEVADYLRPFRDSLSNITREEIGEARQAFVKKKPSGSLGNLVADVLFEQGHVSDSRCVAAVMNYGSIRLNELPAGPITIGKIFELLPFDNEVVILPVSGTLLSRWLLHAGRSGGWPLSSSLHSHLGKDNRIEIILNGLALSNDSIYYIATNDYVAGGGDACDFLQSVPMKHTQVLLRDAMLQYIRSHPSLSADTVNRFIIEP